DHEGAAQRRPAIAAGGWPSAAERLAVRPAAGVSQPSDAPSDALLWRAVDVFRVAALLYAVTVLAREHAGYRHPIAAWAVLGVLAGWTVLLLRRRARTPAVMAADLALAAASVLATVAVDAPERIAAGEQTLPGIW